MDTMTAGQQLRDDMTRALEHTARDAGRPLEFTEHERHTIDSSIAVTGDTYGHTSEDTARAAVDGLAPQLGL
jgi:hypothetical protein